ncbi:MAG: hypothetical protein ACMUJM_25850, partial [bacterium]
SLKESNLKGAITGFEYGIIIPSNKMISIKVFDTILKFFVNIYSPPAKRPAPAAVISVNEIDRYS